MKSKLRMGTSSNEIMVEMLMNWFVLLPYEAFRICQLVFAIFHTWTQNDLIINSLVLREAFWILLESGICEIFFKISQMVVNGKLSWCLVVALAP